MMKLLKRNPAVNNRPSSTSARNEDDSIVPDNDKAIIRVPKISVRRVPRRIKTYFRSRSLSFGLLKISKVKFLTAENIVVPNSPLTCLALLGTTMVAGPTFLNVETLEANHSQELARKVEETKEEGDDFPMRDRAQHSRKRKKHEEEVFRHQIEEGMRKMEMDDVDKVEEEDGKTVATEEAGNQEDINEIEQCDPKSGYPIRNRIGYLSGLDAEERNMLFGEACVRV